MPPEQGRCAGSPSAHPRCSRCVIGPDILVSARTFLIKEPQTSVFAAAGRQFLASSHAMRGPDTNGHFDLLPPADEELDPAALARHERVYRRDRETYAEQTEWQSGV